MGGMAALGLLIGATGRAEAAPETAICAECHEQAKTFGANPHSRVRDKSGAYLVGEAVCATCHGDGAKHVEGSGDKTLIKVPRGQAGAATCLTCHDKSTERTSFKTGVHAATATVNCTTCHTMHSGDPKVPHLLAAKPADLCGGCHPGPLSGFKSKPFAHHLERGGLTCVTCHDPHGREGRHSLKETRGGELPCLSCHAEKRGPFVYEHNQDVAADCLTCHEPHGSSNPKMLKRATVGSLCLECHSNLGAGTLGQQPPAFHNLNVARYQNCTVCHVAIHGSNRSDLLLK